MDCKSVHPGSIPGVASNLPDALLSAAQHNGARAGHAAQPAFSSDAFSFSTASTSPSRLCGDATRR